MKCKRCGDTFEDSEEAMEHVTSMHADRVEEMLQEYATDAEQDAYLDLIDEEEP